MLHKFELKGRENSVFADLLIDGEKVRASGVVFSQRAGECHEAKVYLPAYPDITSFCDVVYVSNAESIKGAISFLRENILRDKALYDAFKSSIKSALDDIEGSMNHEDTAKVILDRIIGKG